MESKTLLELARADRNPHGALYRAARSTGGNDHEVRDAVDRAVRYAAERVGNESLRELVLAVLELPGDGSIRRARIDDALQTVLVRAEVTA